MPHPKEAQSLDDLFADEENRLLKQTRREDAIAQAEWEALTPEQQRSRLETKEAERLAEQSRQERIAAQHEEIYGANDEEDEEADDE